MNHIDLCQALTGEWIGSWGDHSNVRLDIYVIDTMFDGFYYIDDHKVQFQGIVVEDTDHARIYFNPPMDPDSGGWFYYDSKVLEVYCKDRRSTFHKMK
ncbi:hypothetical protein [Cysteiniphilum litorale]|uniref:hypothetical protein n=1 Tax=Cysteiniphilum litorale TaxID=2056700 RepID=UPI003F88091E